MTIKNGTPGNDSLLGTSGSDQLYGFAGNDTLKGGGGADEMYGGLGDDTFYVDLQGDQVFENTNEGTDTVVSMISHTLSANVENLELQEGGGAINGTGNAEKNLILGNSSANVLDGKGGIDRMYGGGGNDTYIVDDFKDFTGEDIGEGVDLVKSSVTYLLQPWVENLELVEGAGAIDGRGNDQDNVITGNSSANGLSGYEGNDTLYGGGGADALYGGEGADKMMGGLGDDRYYVDNNGDTVSEAFNQGRDLVYVNGAVDYTLSANVEDLTLQTAAGAVDGTGNGLANTIEGNFFANTLSGLGGDDTLHGNGGGDTLIGGTGHDTYYVSSSNDEVVELEDQGFDTVYAKSSYTLDPNVEVLQLQNYIAAISGAGNDGDNHIYGNNFNNVLTGNGGNDAIDGGIGEDVMKGGIGDDYYVVNSAGDSVQENSNAGIDGVLSYLDDYVLPENVENLRLDGAAIKGNGNGLDNLIVGSQYENNILIGNGGNDTIDGWEGADTMIGGTGDDTYVVDNGSDSVVELAGQGAADTVVAQANYHMAAGVEVEFMAVSTFWVDPEDQLNLAGNEFGQTITGHDGVNVLSGYGGNDVINAGGGNDELRGGAGVDTLTGGAGNDAFIFKAGEANGDVIVDFLGNGGAAGDILVFEGYGPGATFTQVDANSWQIDYNGGASHEVITFLNGGAGGVHPSDLIFA